MEGQTTDIKKVTSALSEYANAHRNIDTCICECWLSFFFVVVLKETVKCMHTAISIELVFGLCLIFQPYFLLLCVWRDNPPLGKGLLIH